MLMPIAYLIGSIPFGLIVGLAKGVDPRKQGSGNIGATNIGRLLGGRFFALVFTLDLLKGMLPTLAGYFILRGHASTFADYLLWLLVAFAAVFGHMFSVFLGFKGGKGVATSAGILLGLFPYFTLPGLVTIAAWFVAFMPSRYVSLASIVASVTFPIAYVSIGLARGWDVFGVQLPLLMFALVVPALIIYKHRSNIARLRAGTENRVARKKAAPVAP
jgi:glycerol-3-phosphate acyltransferase PlsY